MISAAEGKLAPPQDLTNSIQKQREKLAQRGADAHWQFELFAAQQYREALRFRESLDAWKLARRLAQPKIDEENRDEKLGTSWAPGSGPIRFRFQGDLDSIGSDAAFRGEFKVALEAVEYSESEYARDSLLDRIAYHQAKVDSQAAENTMRRISAKMFPRQWRLFLIQQCVGGNRDHYERAIRQFVEDRPTMTEHDTVHFYAMFAAVLPRLPLDTVPETVQQFQALVERDAATVSAGRVRFDALKCLASLFIGQQRWSDAQQIATQPTAPPLLQTVMDTMVTRLIELKKIDEAAKLSPLSQSALMQIASAYLKANKPDEALLVVENIPNLQSGYSYLASDTAKQFAERGEWSKADRAIAAMDGPEAQLGGFCGLSSIARNLGKTQMAEEYLRKAHGLVPQIPEQDNRFLYTLILAKNYLDIGDFQSAQSLAEQSGDIHTRIHILVSIAEKQFAQSKLADFQATLQKLKLLEDQQRPIGGTDPERQQYLQSHSNLLMAWLYTLADDKSNATKAMAKSLAGSQEMPGSFWRFDVYSEFLETRHSPSDLKRIASLSEAISTPTDRAILEWLSGAIASKQTPANDPAQPRPFGLER